MYGWLSQPASIIGLKYGHLERAALLEKRRQFAGHHVVPDVPDVLLHPLQLFATVLGEDGLAEERDTGNAAENPQRERAAERRASRRVFRAPRRRAR